MASRQGPTDAAHRAGDVARRLEQGWIGTEHVLVALFDDPGPAAEALEELGITRELAEESARGYSRSDPPPPAYDPDKGLSPSPAWYGLNGCAKGLALASGRRRPRPEHFLLAMVYGEHTVGPLLHELGSDERALVDALARRGVPVPEVDPPAYRPWRGRHRIDVTEAELKPLLQGPDRAVPGRFGEPAVGVQLVSRRPAGCGRAAAGLGRRRGERRPGRRFGNGAESASGRRPIDSDRQSRSVRRRG
jgi:hypothetical protein